VCVCVCAFLRVRSDEMSMDAGHSDCSLLIVHQDEVLGLCKCM